MIIQGDKRANTPNYDLFAVLNHYGGLGRGHYVTHAMNRDDKYVVGGGGGVIIALVGKGFWLILKSN